MSSREYSRKYYEKNKEKIKRRQHQYYLENKDILLERVRQYKHKHPEKVAEYNRIHYGRNKEHINTQQAEYKEKHKEELRQKDLQSRIRLREKVFDILGRKCVRCGFCDIRALQVDHVNGGGSGQRKELNVYKEVVRVDGEGFQMLCANCNWIKRHENGEAPHIL